MIELTPDLFGITVDIRFSKARPFSKERLDRLLSRLTDSENGLALRPEQMRLRSTDLAFDYELKAFFLGANAVLVCDAEKFFLSVSGGRTQADANLLRETAKRFLWTSEISDQDSGLFGASTHARAESTEKRDEFLKTFRVNDQIVGPGALAYIRAPSWSEDIRFSVEPSLGIPEALFLAWNTRFRGVSWPTSGETLTNILELPASVFGVRFKPFTQP
jgi:hypothetical protein